MSDDRLTRRDFVGSGAAAAAGLAAGLTSTQTVFAGNPTNKKTEGILNYNEQMEYRRAGKTNLMVSAVCLGGHWKRLNTVVPDIFKGGGWLSAALENEGFQKNRCDVVTRCIERGINYIDACTAQEVTAYAKALEGRRDKMYLGFSWYQQEMRSLSTEMFKAEKAGKPEQIVCTNCHGNHRMERRTVRWNKRTGHLIVEGNNGKCESPGDTDK